MHLAGTPRWYLGHACARDAAPWQNTALLAHGNAWVPTFSEADKHTVAHGALLIVCGHALLSITHNRSGIDVHSLLCVMLVANIVQWWIFEFWIAAMCIHSDHYPDTWRTGELLNFGQWWNFYICGLRSSNSHLHTVNGAWYISSMWVPFQLCCPYTKKKKKKNLL